MEQNTDRMWWTIGVIVLGALLIGGGIVLANENILPKISQAFVKMLDDKDKINPDDAKWVDWTDIPIETFESKPNKEVGGIGYINKNNFIKYEESGSIAIEESPYFGSGMGSTPGKGKGSYKVSMSIPKQKGLLTGVFLYGYDETNDRSYEIDIETMFYKGEWQIWTTIYNSTHPNYEYGKYLTGKSWVDQIDEPEPGVIFQERVSMEDLGGFLDPSGNIIPGKKHIFQIDYMTDYVAFHVNGKQIAKWNDTFHNPDDIVMDFTLSTFWTHWLGRPETWDYEEIDFDNVQFKSE